MSKNKQKTTVNRQGGRKFRRAITGEMVEDATHVGAVGGLRRSMRLIERREKVERKANDECVNDEIVNGDIMNGEQRVNGEVGEVDQVEEVGEVDEVDEVDEADEVGEGGEVGEVDEREEGGWGDRVAVEEIIVENVEDIGENVEDIVDARRKLSHNDCRILYAAYVDSKMEGWKGYKERLLDGWVRRGMQVMDANKLKKRVREAEKRLAKVEMNDIRKKVEREKRGEGNRERGDLAHHHEAGVCEEANVEANVDGVRVNVHRIDLWKKGDEVTLLSEEHKKVLARLREVFASEEVVQVPSLKSRNRGETTREVELVEGLLHNLLRKGMGITEVNKVVHSGSVVVAERLGLMKKGKGKRQARKEPWWKRRIEKDITGWRKDLSRVEAVRQGRVMDQKVIDRLNSKYELVDKGALTVMTFLRSKIQSGSAKIRAYLERGVQFHQNNLFRNNQSQLYQELNGSGDRGENPVPEAGEATEFWSGIWGNEMRHDEEAPWIEGVKRKFEGVERQEAVGIGLQEVKDGVRRMSSWKAPGPDGIRGFWFKQFPSVHQAIAEGLQTCMDDGNVPDWMVKGRTVLIQKDKAKGTVASNYRPIACLPLMWKLLTGIFADKIYDHLKDNNLLPDEQKGGRKESRGTKDQLMIDKAVMREAKAKRRCLSMAWIDYKKAYDMVPHSWLLEVMGMMGVAENVDGLMRGSMGKWRTVLTANGEELGEINLKRGIFQGDSLSPLLFVMIMTPLSILLREEGERGYALGSDSKLMNHLLFMDDLKLYAKSSDDLDALVNLVGTYSKDICMEFGMDKCAVVHMKKGKRVRSEGLTLPSGEVMKDVDQSGYKYLGVLQADQVKSVEMKEKIKVEYFRRVKLLGKSKLYAGNLVNGINAWAVGVVRYSAGILDWTRKDVRAMDVKTRKILTMCGAYRKQSSVDRLYMKRKDGGRGLISVEECVESEVKSLGEYVAKSEEWMLKEVAKVSKIGEGHDDYRKRVDRERKERLQGKKVHGRFMEDVREVADERSWQWVKAGYLTPSTESYIFGAQEQALRTRWRRADIEKEDVERFCRICRKPEQVENVSHLASGCGELAKKQYKIRHDRMGLRIHWELCRKYGIECAARWYEHVPASVCRNGTGDVEIWWDVTVETVGRIAHNRPDVVIINRREKKWTLVDFSVPLDKNVLSKENEKLLKYAPLAQEVRRVHKVTTSIVPVVMGCLGTVPKRLSGYLRELGVPDVIGCMQTTALLGTARILKNVLSV